MALTYLNSKMIEEPAILDQLYVTSLTALSTTIQNTLTNDLTAFNVTDSSVISVDSINDALRITQVGTGNALLVEDSSNPDATPFVVKSDGRVGIGVTEPAATLDVIGTVKMTSLSSSNFILNTNGRVGIGTTTPAATLDVVGNSRFTNLTALNVSTQNLILPQDGGSVINDAIFFGNLTVFGAISALSGLAVTSTFTSQSSALSVVNTGPEVALYVDQSPNLSGVAVFVGSGVEVLKVNNPNPNPDNLPAVVVNGVLSASGGTSTNWNTAFNRSTVFSSVSSRYNSSSTIVESNSANWNSAFNVGTVFSSVSSRYNSSSTVVESNSANWNSAFNIGTVYSATSASYPRKFATDIGNGSLTAFEVTHSLGTRDIITTVYDNTNYDIIITSVKNLTTNTVGLSFDTAPGSNAYRVVVIG